MADSVLRADTFVPPFDGIDTDSAPEAIPDSKAPVVENFLVDRPGQLPMRGPINEATGALGVSAGRKLVGCWKFNDKLLLGYRAVSATAVRDPWTVNYRTATAAQLATAALANKHVDLVTGTVTSVVPATVGLVPGPSSTRLGAFVYGISFDTPTAAVNENGTFKKLTSLLHWDGTATDPVAHTNAPRGAQAVRSHSQRLFVLGGRNPDGTGTIQQNTLWWSDPIAGVTVLPDTLAAWQDDTSGLTNQIIVDSDDASDFGVGLANLGANLVIFKRRSIHVLTGYSSSTWQIKTFTLEQGCIDARSIVECEDVVFFMSDQGYMAFDGTQIRSASMNLNSSLLASAVAAVGSPGQDGGRACAARLPNGYIGLTIGKSSSASIADVSTTSFCGLYHVERGAWVTLQSDTLVSGCPLYMDRSTSKTFIVDEDQVLQANKLTAPEQEIAVKRGFDTNGSIGGPIKARFQSKLCKLSSPLMRSQLHRFMLDYNFRVVGTLDDNMELGFPGSSGWYVTLLTADGDVLTPEYQVPIQGETTVHPFRRRHVKDVFAEASDLQVRVEWRDTPLSLITASVLGFTAEYQTTRARPTQ